MKILIEATGSLTSGYLIHSIQEGGHDAVGSDISKANHGFELCDDFILMPKTKDPELWSKTEALLLAHKIDMVIPSLDESMLGWAERAEDFAKKGIKVIVSPLKTIQTFQDKWETFKFFDSIGIDVPATSTEATYPLIKPRLGRGSTGIYIQDVEADTPPDMTGMISQELIKGTEYTVDCLFDKEGQPIYIIPRERLDVKEGKSTKGRVVYNEKIREEIIYVANKIELQGPINFQLFVTDQGEHKYIEVNPRIAGGMALGFAASENWMPLLVENFLGGKKIEPKPVNYELTMYRYYSEIFV